MSRKIILSVVITIAILTGCLLYLRHQVYFSHGEENKDVIFEIKKGEGNAQISTRLAENGLVSNRVYFYYYLRVNGFLNRIIPGDYKLSGNMTIPEIANAIANPEETFIKVTFPEGLTSVEMADILEKEGLDKNGFLELVKKPEMFSDRYDFLKDARIKTLEGYLFPDTYFFKSENTAEQIMAKILNNFQSRMTGQVKNDIESRGGNMHDIIIMASIVEGEVPTPADMKIVAGVFANRLSINMPIQSDATLSFVLNDKTDQHSIEQTKIDSPYNTYKYRGLPPGPVSNPGMNAINAAINPPKTDYTYFLTVDVDGRNQTIFSKTFEEHVANRKKYGL